ncbi:MAG: hypothetical protein WB445_04660 [Acinetobacter sp.]
MNYNFPQLQKTAGLSLLPLSIFYSAHSFAGADVYCTPSTELQGNAYTACDNLPALTPANDNQTNMLLLLSDLGLASVSIPNSQNTLWMTSYSIVPFETKAITASSKNKAASARQPSQAGADPYQEHCSSLSQGAQDFLQQIQADKNLSSSEKLLLASERNKISSCASKIPLISVNPNWSAPARQYASYLNATIAFYNANFSTASKIYSVLAGVEQPWLKETSQYMLIRSNLNAAYQSGVGEYGDLQHDKLNQILLKDFFSSITDYFKLYPNGQYAASARGLLRRGYWLNGRHDLLVNEFVWQINHPKSKLYNLEISNLAYEIDRHVFQSSRFKVQNLNDPFFLAIYDLMQMRKPETAEDKVISWAELNVQKAAFKGQPELFQYLQANHLFFVQNKAQDALKYLPSDAPAAISSYLQLSQILLKGRIQEKLGQSQEKNWEALLAQAKTPEQRGLFELMLYPHYAKQQNAAMFMGANAKIKQKSLQKSFIEEAANEKSLMQFAQSADASTDQKNLTLFNILQKSLIHQNFGLFNQAYALLPKNAAQYVYNNETFEHYKNQPPLGNFIWKGAKVSSAIQCSDLYSLTQKLEQSPKDLKLRLCLGEYIRSEQGYSVNSLTYTEKDRSSFQGPVFTRGQVYKDIIKASSDPEMKAYALYRSIMCYSPSGMNDCQDNEVATSTRKQWYDQIKRDYPTTSWAKSLKYYW